jgi:threonine dehydrogenase-like Zn-dependent dehydrogenase
MRALVLDGTPQVTDIPVPRPGPGEALVQVLAAGVCNTDVELTRGYMAFKGTFGHEFVGQVAEASNEQLIGKRVVGEINCVCHTCQFCQLEMPHHCLNRSVLGILNRDGAFAEFLTIPEENLHLVPNSIRDDVAVFTEPLAAAFRILEQVEILPGDRVIVLGDGKLGQLIAQVLWIKTKRLACVGKHAWKLDMLKKLGIATVHTDEPIEGMADVVVESTGSYSGLQRALELVRPEGTIVLKTTVTHPTALDFSGPVINEVRIIGSRCGPFRPALDALAMGNVEVRPMITESYSLSDGVYALERAQSPEVMKVILHM